MDNNETNMIDLSSDEQVTEYTVTLRGHRLCVATVTVEAEDMDTAMAMAYEAAEQGVDWFDANDVIDIEIQDVTPDDEEDDEEE